MTVAQNLGRDLEAAGFSSFPRSPVERRPALELRAARGAGSGHGRLEGYAAVFDSASQDLGGFVEFVRPGAFKRSLESNRIDPLALVQHMPHLVLGRRIGGDAEAGGRLEGAGVRYCLAGHPNRPRPGGECRARRHWRRELRLHGARRRRQVERGGRSSDARSFGRELARNHRDGDARLSRHVGCEADARHRSSIRGRVSCWRACFSKRCNAWASGNASSAASNLRSAARRRGTCSRATASRRQAVSRSNAHAAENLSAVFCVRCRLFPETVGQYPLLRLPHGGRTGCGRLTRSTRSPAFSRARRTPANARSNFSRCKRRTCAAWQRLRRDRARQSRRACRASAAAPGQRVGAALPRHPAHRLRLPRPDRRPHATLARRRGAAPEGPQRRWRGGQVAACSARARRSAPQSQSKGTRRTRSAMARGCRGC